MAYINVLNVKIFGYLNIPMFFLVVSQFQILHLVL